MADHARQASDANSDNTLVSIKTNARSEQADERTPLLTRPVEEDSQDFSREAWISESKALWKLAIPNWIALLLEFSIGGITTVTAGRLGTKELNAASLAQITMTSLCLAPLIYGFSTALDTLATQAFTSSNPKNTALYVQRTGVLILLGCIPCYAVLYMAEDLFLLIRQDPYVASLAGRYIRISLAYVPFLAISELTRRWLQAQGLVKVPSLIFAVSAPTAVGLNILLVHGPPSIRLGFIGAPVALTFTNIITCFLIIAYCYFFVPRKAWMGFSRAMFLDLGPNIRLGIAGTLSVCSEWLAWDTCALVSSYLGSSQFAANQISLLFASLAYQLPYALGTAAGVRVGNHTGKGDARQAALAARCAYASGFGLGIVNSAIVLIFGPTFMRFVTKDPEVLRYLHKMLLLVAIFQMGDDIAGAAFGILRGAGLASTVANANLAAYWTCGIPLGLLLTFHFEFGVVGIWTGHVCSLGLLAVLLSYRVARVDWRKQCEKAKEQATATQAFLDSLRGGCEETR